MNMLRAQYTENSWRCHFTNNIIANYEVVHYEAVHSARLS